MLAVPDEIRKETLFMVGRRITLALAVAASAAVAVPAAQASSGAGPVARSAGGDAPALNPALIGIPMARTDKALGSAADFIDQGNGALAAKPLTAVRRYLIRSYNGARYLVALPPPPAEEGSANPATFRRMARKAVKASHRGVRRSAKGSRSRWIKAHKSDGPAGPVIADTPTAVFNVLTSQYSAATAAVGMYPDTTGKLQAKVKLVLNTAIILRNRLVKAIAVAEPPAPAEEGRVLAHKSDGPPLFADLMPGLVVLLDDEIQQMTVAASSLPAAARADVQKAIAADQKVETLVNSLWPPAPAD
jgi:hypothetical protein